MLLHHNSFNHTCKSIYLKCKGLQKMCNMQVICSENFKLDEEKREMRNKMIDKHNRFKKAHGT